jgi:putative endonuclease
MQHLACEIGGMFYVYVLRSLADAGLYIGCTGDLGERIRSHQSGRVESTRNRLPIELIYYEACLNRGDAFRREKYLKTTYGRRYLKSRLKEYFTG